MIAWVDRLRPSPPAPLPEGERRNKSKAFDACAELDELAVEAFVAAVEVPHGMEDGFALGGQSGEDQRGAGPEIGGGYGRGAEPGHAFDDRGIALHGDFRAEPIEFGGMEKTILEDRVAQPARAVGQCDERRPLGLDVGGHAGIRLGDQLARQRTPRHIERNPIGAFSDFRSRIFQ